MATARLIGLKNGLDNENYSKIEESVFGQVVKSNSSSFNLPHRYIN